MDRGNVATFGATRTEFDALRDIYDLAWQQYVDWMHFHEIAMAEPFKAEAEAQAFCRNVLKAVLAAGIDRGHNWKPLNADA